MKMPNARKVVAALRKNVDALLMATALAEVERERIDEIARAELASQIYTGRNPHRPEMAKGFRITEPKDAWHMCDHDAQQYYAKLNATYVRLGYKLPSPSHCPALMAETVKTKAEWALIAAALEFFPTCDNDTLLCGTKDKGGLELRQEYLDLLIGLVVNAPGYRSPLKGAN